MDPFQLLYSHVNQILRYNKVSGGCRQPLRQFNKITLGQLCPWSCLPACNFPAPPSSPQLKAHPPPGSGETKFEHGIKYTGLPTLHPSPYSFWSYPVSVAPGRGWREGLVRTQKLYANQNQGGLISQLGGAEKAVSDHTESRDLK